MKTVFSILALIVGSPLVSNCTQAKGDAADNLFEYREIYLPESSGKKAAPLGLNSVDTDWGIWGHHLKDVLPADASMSVYAEVDGQRTREQFCFSSERLFQYLEDYIENKYGESQTFRFAILPNDNALVCHCADCLKAGNEYKNASPAVHGMIARLAKRFPMHIFFTSYYRTTRSLPTHPMPENTGVLVSTMNYHLSPVVTDEDAAFEELIHSWRDCVSHVYVWDYVNNFDDYFAPFPLFTIMQRRMQLYAKAGVSGIFLNGSGTDYSTLSHLKVLVLSDLMKNPYQDLQRLVRDRCAQLYPVAGKTIADFVLQQEAWTQQQGKRLPIYEGITQALKTYLPEQEFVTFYEQLLAQLKQTSGEERKEVETMCQAMAQTRLELMRLSGDISGCQPLLSMMGELPQKGVKVYSETCWLVDNYVSEYAAMADHAKATASANLLLGKQLSPLTALDEDYNDISILTDGLLGLPSNYHCGQLLSSADPALRIAIPHVDGMKTVKVWFTRNVLFHIVLPKMVSLSAGNVQIAAAQPQPDPANPHRAVVELALPPQTHGALVLTIVRDKADRTMAIDEIEGFR